MEEKIKSASANLQYLGTDPFKRMLKPEEFGADGATPQLDLCDPDFDNMDVPAAVESLKIIENSGLAFSTKIVPAGRAEFSGGRSYIYLVTSEGVKKSYAKSLYSFSYTAVAEENEQKERDYWSESKRHFSELPAAEDLGAIGKTAAQRAVRRMGGKKIAGGERKVIFARRTAGSLLGLLCDAVDGEEIVVNNSFLLNRLGETLFSDKITVIDNPLMTRYPGSYPFDGEGMNGVLKSIVEKGKLQTYVHNSYSAGKLGMALTGNASRSISGEPHIMVGNFYLESGSGSLEDLAHEMKEGLLVEELYVSGMNSVTGDFSFGCSGFLVEQGIITTPVREITIAGNLLELYKNVLEIADDNLFRSSVTSPSIMVSNLMVSGT